MEKLPPETEKAEVAEELPEGLERRLALRLLSYWRSICGDAAVPRFSDLKIAEISDMWPHCFVLEMVGSPPQPVFQDLGDVFVTFSRQALLGRPVSEAPPDSLAGVATTYAVEAFEKGIPISRGGVFYGPDGSEILYRSIMLPMADDEGNITVLLGAVNCREPADG